MSGLHPIWVDDPSAVRGVAERCGAAGRFALDTEADSMHSYFHKVCLIQVTAGDDHMVIDPLPLAPADLEPLWALVGDPGVPVLMHGADYDVRILDRDYGVTVAGLQDTQIMAQLLGEEKTGLAALLEKELDVGLDKKHQRADWGRRPLRAAQLAYAAADTAYLEELVQRLRARLDDLGRWEWAEEEFRKLEKVRHNQVEPDPLAFERIKGARRLEGAARNRLYSLYEWRDRTARSLDVPPFKTVGNKALLALAEEPPADLAELGEVEGIGQRAVRRWGRSLLRLFDRPRHAPKKLRTRPPPSRSAAENRRLKRLIAVRDAKAEELGIQTGLLCSRGTAEVVAARRPPCGSNNDLVEAGLVGWRLQILGDDFLTAISED